MLNKKLNITKKNLILFLYVAILSLLGPLIFWIGERNTSSPLSSETQSEASSKRISLGEKILVTADTNPEKLAGVQAFGTGDYTSAIEKFSSSLQINRNDPEALIYFNNAKAALSRNTVKLATSVPIGGNLNVAKEILRGIAQAQQEINQQGGIGGKLVVVEIANDDNDPEIAKQIARDLASNENVLAVIGHNDSNASIAAAPTYQQAGLVMITPTSSAENIPAMGDYIFRTTPSSRTLADTLARYAVNSANKTKFAICTDSNSEVSKSFEKEFTWSVYDLGGEVTETDCDLSAANFNPNIIPSQAVSDGANALLLAPSVRSVDKAIEVAKANQGRLALLGNHSTHTYATLQEGQANVNGMVSIVAWTPEVKPKSAFVQNAKQLWGGAVNWRTAMAYDATKAAIAGFKSGFSRKNLQQTLAGSRFSTSGAIEDIEFLPSGDRIMKGVLVEVLPSSKTSTGYDFVPVENQSFK